MKHPITSLSTSLTGFWYSAGVLVRTKDKTKYSVSKRCVERHFPLVPLSDTDKVVGIPEVDLVNPVAPWRGAKAELMSGKVFFTVL